MSADEIIKLATKGNASAESFCRSWVTFCHLVDDLHDKDKAVSDDYLAGMLCAHTVELASNPFFQLHKEALIALMIQSANAWLDANRMRLAANPQLWVASDVLKGFYHEVVFHCAMIVGGWTHLRQVTQECREYDFERTGA